MYYDLILTRDKDGRACAIIEERPDGYFMKWEPGMDLPRYHLKEERQEYGCRSVVEEAPDGEYVKRADYEKSGATTYVKFRK